MSDDLLLTMADKVLRLDNADIQADFIIATWQALENMAEEFEFRGFLIETSLAIDVTNELYEQITIH